MRKPSKHTQSVESRVGLLMRWLPEFLVLVLAGVLFLVNLTANGYANEYYSAAAWAGSKDWTAWLFSSVDPENFLATDKPPLSTMVMGLSVRAFGLSPLAILLPQALSLLWSQRPGGVAMRQSIFCQTRAISAMTRSPTWPP